MNNISSQFFQIISVLIFVMKKYILYKSLKDVYSTDLYISNNETDMILWAKYVVGTQENAYLSDSLGSLYGQ